MSKISNIDTTKKIGEEVTLKGWVHSRRDHGKLMFLDLRDSTGLVQIVVNPGKSEDAHKVASEISIEDVVKIKGLVNKRPEKLVNPNLETGEVEVEAQEIKIISHAETPPFEIDQ